MINKNVFIEKYKLFNRERLCFSKMILVTAFGVMPLSSGVSLFLAGQNPQIGLHRKVFLAQFGIYGN